MKYFLSILILVGVLQSCVSVKTNSKHSTNAQMNLEQFLTKNNNYVKIPLEKMPSGHLHINGIVNGVNGSFILDTGAGATVIDNNKTEKFKLQLEDTETTGAGAGGTTSLQISGNNQFKIGALEKPQFDLYVMNIDHVNNAFKAMGLAEVDGVIGADILSSNKGIIDYSELVLYLKK